MPPHLAAIWIKRARLGPMDPVDSAELITGRGLLGNANQGGKRQVTILAIEAWEDLMTELDIRIDPSARRANLLLEGLSLQETQGRSLRIGGCLLRIEGQTHPCERMDQAHPGLQAAMKPFWRGGVFATVVSGGTIHLGDPASLDDPS